VLQTKERAPTPYFSVVSPQIHIRVYQGAWERITWYQSSSRAQSIHWGVLMEPKRTRKLIQKTMVEEPTQDLDIPFEIIREEEQEDFENQEDRDKHDDHENEGGATNYNIFHLKTIGGSTQNE
jgi:hypothetical protein